MRERERDDVWKRSGRDEVEGRCERESAGVKERVREKGDCGRGRGRNEVEGGNV